jgi:isopentenyldiphosphate isomerase
MAFLDRIRECNAHDLANFRPFVVAGQRVGWVRHAFAERLARFSDTFDVAREAVRLSDGLTTFAARTDALEVVVRALEADGTIKGRRNEYYPVSTSFAAEPLARIERAAIPAFGIRAYGVHMNGFVRRADGIHMWIGRRARDKHTYPGMLDNTVAGGQPMGIGLRENLVKECKEEAAIPEALARQAVPVGAITYCMEAEDGLKPDVQFCYDLELPADFTPRNTDGEIDEFMLWPIAKVAAVVRDTQEFKFNCNLVIIDFLVRHGLIAPEHPDYLEIVAGLRR